MSGQAWLIFCAACAVVFALPSPLVFSVASYAAIRGRKTIFASVGGGALGVVTAMTISAIPVAGLVYLPQSFLEIVQWAGIGWLMLFVLWTFATPAAQAANADNDNLPGKSWSGIFRDCYAVAALRPRYFSFFLALLPQFVSTTGNAVETLAMAQAAILILTCVILAAQAMFAGQTLALVRRMSGDKKIRPKYRTHFISGRAVSAGYRRIAA
ncbi:LysE family translocator [Agrobacterium fabrum]|jgi:threonine/homoserine/homoserine lactone efflux protein|uniref:Threonine/homoserine/homoserine lactone efflux protein n=1 Tax=Agrobacterium fabrum TaxID=1176649 RepID=A0A7Z7FLQ8_9HYPH|nr:LysE family translocator [Agrobacterium fabrum]AYM57818.1 lysine transporter LysE [Agrobacterium fabrum]MCR6724447.1 LysE family translocator [Agrobacterium fabrum]MDH6296029.1 threonine/homoserine/homoserine lactone efflux protein [Agrobacterium fabrum]NSZ12163.1 LysE family translocator [Agrobacterium fabrum]UXT57772.1 LysE family translocator [Agrobacterium fabrum]